MEKSAIEDDQAIGELRTPRLSIKKLKGVAVACKELRRMIDEYIESSYVQLFGALDTLGKAEMPDVLAEAADILRRQAAEWYNVPASEDHDLQGPLLQKIGLELEDLDTEVFSVGTRR